MSSVSNQSPPASPGSSSGSSSPHYSPVYAPHNPESWNEGHESEVFDDGFALPGPKEVTLVTSGDSLNSAVPRIAGIFSVFREISPENTLSDGGGSPRIQNGLGDIKEEEPELENSQKLPADFMFRLYPIPK